MKLRTKRIFLGLIATVLVATLTVPAFAAEQTIKDSVNNQQTTTQEQQTNTITFKDIPSTHWAYSAISAMSVKGLFSGKQAYEDGTARFAPDDTMTRAEFITVVVRALYKSELEAMPKAEKWYQNAYDVAINNGLLTESDLDKGNLDKVMNRQEMSMVLVRAAEKNGETPSQLIDTSRIPDYNIVGNYYRDYVRKAYSMGMLCGTDKSGTFSPQGTLNRAQGATVLYRLVEVSSREKVDFSKPSDNQQGAITIQEGQTRTNSRMAKAGDTVIKADGTRVVLKVGPNGILGEGQGVAPDLGLVASDGWGTVKDQEVFNSDSYGKDSTGADYRSQTYYVNPLTGEGHWGSEWAKLCNATLPQYDGKTDGEISKDKNFVWVAAGQEWMDVANNTYLLQ